MKKQAPEFEITNCVVRDDGRLIFAVQFDDESREVNFCVGQFSRAQVIGEDEWFSRGADGDWVKINGNGAVIVQYKKNMNRISRLLEKMASRAMMDLILGE